MDDLGDSTAFLRVAMKHVPLYYYYLFSISIVMKDSGGVAAEGNAEVLEHVRTVLACAGRVLLNFHYSVCCPPTYSNKKETKEVDVEINNYVIGFP